MQLRETLQISYDVADAILSFQQPLGTVDVFSLHLCSNEDGAATTHSNTDGSSVALQLHFLKPLRSLLLTASICASKLPSSTACLTISNVGSSSSAEDSSMAFLPLLTSMTLAP